MSGAWQESGWRLEYVIQYTTFCKVSMLGDGAVGWLMMI